MRILVISDSHRNSRIVEDIIRSQPTAQKVFFLGDVTGDIEDLQYVFPDKVFFIVSGNCDIMCGFRNIGIAEAAGKKIFYTHGHTYGVKYGTDALAKAARERGCDIALYGHTHVSSILYEDGLYIVNPGSCSESRSGSNSYAVIDIEKNGIMPVVIEL